MGTGTGAGAGTRRREGFDPTTTYTVIEGASATTVPGGDAFWEALGRGAPPPGAEAVERGWLVATFPMGASWDVWEVHPEGDEVVLLLAGAIDLVLERAGGLDVVALTAGRAAIVPAGTWHTAVVREPGVALHVTWGAGTDHRPLADHPLDPAVAGAP
jgi:mannose-6-phosphate isomerase-like protein (cupin superfamily)